MEKEDVDGLELTDYYFMNFEDGDLTSQLFPVDEHFAEIFVEHHGMKKTPMSYDGRNAYLWKEK